MKTSNFKIIFIGVFIALAVLGVMVFSGIISLGGNSATTAAVSGTVTIWGTFDAQAMTGYVNDFNQQNQDIHIAYVYKDPSTLDGTLVEAIATGTAPDLVLLPDNLVWRFSDKVTHIPFTSLPAQTYDNTFISSADIFSTTDGYLAMPWASDPLIMYYNRDLLQNVGIAEPPKMWKAFTDSVPLLAKKQSDLTLTQMATAMGTYKNIAHPKDMLALLFLEGGSQFINENAGLLAVHFGTNSSATEAAAAIKATDFYMSFANPLNPLYSWNAGEPLDRDLFSQSNLAYYFGTASELPALRAKNPNLNFGIALPPQAPTGTSVTTGRVYGFVIPKSAANPLLSYTAATLLASPTGEGLIVSKTGTTLALMPVRRDVLAQKPVNDPYLGFLFDAALVQKSWLDPNPALSDQVFVTLIRDINSSVLGTDAALAKAASQLSALSVRI